MVMRTAKAPARPKPAPVPTFVEFCELIRTPLSPAQTVLAAVCFDGAPVPAEHAPMFGGHVGPVPASARRTLAWLCGRGSGKTRLAALFILWRCLFADLARLARGEIGFGVVFSPTLELSEQTLRFARGALEGTKFERAIVADTRTSFTIKRPDGKTVRFAVLAAAKGGMTGRGRTLVACAIDEGCFFASETRGAVNDADVYRALPPRLIEGGAIVIASTPWTPEGLLHSLWLSDFGKPTSALVAVAKTEVMRSDDPTVLADCAVARLRDPDNAARELDCEWLATGGGKAFDLDSLARAVAEDVKPPEALESIYVGGDFAMVNDRTAFVAIRASRDGEMVDVVDCIEMRPPKGRALDLDSMLVEASEFVERNHARRVVRVDGHIIEAARQSADRQGLGLTLERCSEASTDRELRFTRAIDLFKAGRVRIPKRFAWLTEQLSSIVATPRDGGGWRFSAARRAGSHADAASAFLLAVEAFHRARFPTAEEMAAFGAIVQRHMTREPMGIFEAVDQAALRAPRVAPDAERLQAVRSQQEDEDEPATSMAEGFARLVARRKRLAAVG
jgi:hypothetical protein